MARVADSRWVVNASPLICLGKIGRLDLFSALADEVVIPAGVANEVGRGPASDAARAWLEAEGAQYLRPSPPLDPVIVAWDLGMGETEVIAWARANPGFRAVVDDRAARRCADVLGLRVLGTLGILVLARRHGIVAELGPVLKQVTAAGLHLNPAIVREALTLVDED